MAGKAEAYFREIVYAAANEDSASELKALRLGADDEVLCITASGARPLDLLTALPKRIVSIDLNPAQNRLLLLKMAAMRALAHGDFLAFLGVTGGMTGTQRLSLLDGLLVAMNPEDQAFWRARRPAVAHGVIYAGIWERNLRATARLAWFRRGTIAQLLSCTTLAQQQELWQRQWDNWAWRALLRVIACRPLWTYVAKEPGMALVPADFDIYAYMHQRLDQAAKHLLLADEPFAHLFLRGAYAQERALPMHLRPEHYDRIKNNLDRIEVITASLADVLAKPSHAGRFQAFSLSDFSTYCTPEAYRAIWQQILQAARRGARVCERQFLVKLDPCAYVGKALQRDRALEQALDFSDGGIFYTFVCGEILA